MFCLAARIFFLVPGRFLSRWADEQVDNVD
jgi:hypothetical protein